MTVNVIDTNTLVGLKAGADLYNSNFTDTANAASKLVGTLATEVPTNADLPTFGTAAEADLGLLAGNALAADDINANGDVWGAGNVEYGTNANGEYWKYPDGLLICRHTDIGVRSFGAFATAAWFGGFTLVFPTAYITSPTVSSSITTSGQITWVEAAPATTTDCVFTLIANAQLVSVNVEVSFTAVGRWK